MVTTNCPGTSCSKPPATTWKPLSCHDLQPEIGRCCDVVHTFPLTVNTLCLKQNLDAPQKTRGFGNNSPTHQFLFVPGTATSRRTFQAAFNICHPYYVQFQNGEVNTFDIWVPWNTFHATNNVVNLVNPKPSPKSLNIMGSMNHSQLRFILELPKLLVIFMFNFHISCAMAAPLL